MTVTLCITFGSFVDLVLKCYPIISSFAILAIVGMLFYALFGKRKKEFTIGVRKEIVIWVTMLCSLIALCRTFPIPLDFDYMGIIVSIFSLLVTILVGWNIYQIIDVKNIRENFDKIESGMTRKTKSLINEEIENFLPTIRASVSLHGVDVSLVHKFPELIVMQIVFGIDEALKGTHNEDVIQYGMTMLLLAIDEDLLDKPIFKKGYKQRCLDIIGRVDNSNVDKQKVLLMLGRGEEQS